MPREGLEHFTPDLLSFLVIPVLPLLKIAVERWPSNAKVR